MLEGILGKNRPEAPQGINHTPLPREYTLVTERSDGNYNIVPDSRRPLSNPLQERRGYIAPIAQIPPAPEYSIQSAVPGEYQLQSTVPPELRTYAVPDPEIS